MDDTDANITPSNSTQSGGSVPIPLSAHLSHNPDGSDGTPGMVPHLPS